MATPISARGIDPEELGFSRATSVDVDDRGRVVLGKALSATSKRHQRFAAFVNPAGQIVLDPIAEIPAREKWLFDNPSALAAVRNGVKTGRTSPLVDRGSFAQYADDAED